MALAVVLAVLSAGLIAAGGFVIHPAVGLIVSGAVLACAAYIAAYIEGVRRRASS